MPLGAVWRRGPTEGCLLAHLVRAKEDVPWVEDHVIVGVADTLVEQLRRREACGAESQRAASRDGEREGGGPGIAAAGVTPRAPCRMGWPCSAPS
jgi:hypothetical protein